MGRAAPDHGLLAGELLRRRGRGPCFSAAMEVGEALLLVPPLGRAAAMEARQGGGRRPCSARRGQRAGKRGGRRSCRRCGGGG